MNFFSIPLGSFIRTNISIISLICFHLECDSQARKAQYDHGQQILNNPTTKNVKFIVNICIDVQVAQPQPFFWCYPASVEIKARENATTNPNEQDYDGTLSARQFGPQRVVDHIETIDAEHSQSGNTRADVQIGGERYQLAEDLRPDPFFRDGCCKLNKINSYNLILLLSL